MRKIIVNTIKYICQTIVQLVKQAFLLPQTIANAIRQRRRRADLKELEVERLDRIRNPSKYRGR